VPRRESEPDPVDEPIVLEPSQPDPLRTQTIPALAEKRSATLPAGKIVARFEPDDLAPSESTIWS